MDIRTKVAQLSARMHDAPQYPTQGAVLFVDLERREHFSKYLPVDVLRSFLSGRGANMFLLHNLLLDGREPLDPQIPLIFGSGVFTGTLPSAARGNLTSVAPDSDAFLDSNCGDFFPAYQKLNGYDHLVLYGRSAEWVLLELSGGKVRFHDATPYLGMDNTDLTAAVEKDFSCDERKNMAMARITRAGENLVLCAGIMGGAKAIYARGGTGAKMGSLRLKAVMILGIGEPPDLSRGLQGEQPRSRAEDPVDQRRQVRPEKGGYPLPLQAQPHPRRDGDEKQPGDELVRHPRRRQLRRVPARHGRLLPVPDPLPSAERPHPGREGGVGRERPQGGDRERRVRRRPGGDRTPAGEELQGDPGRRHVRPPRQGGRARLCHPREVGAHDRHPRARTGPAPQQHRKRPRAGLGQHGERDRLGDGALPARHHHGEGDRRARPDVGQVRGHRKAPVHDVADGKGSAT